MSVNSKPFFWVECDCCGAPPEVDNGMRQLFDNADDAIHYAIGEAWERVGDEWLCESCWTWPESLPDYPGDAAYTGSDDPVRRHAVHPGSES